MSPSSLTAFASASGRKDPALTADNAMPIAKPMVLGLNIPLKMLTFRLSPVTQNTPAVNTSMLSARLATHEKAMSSGSFGNRAFIIGIPKKLTFPITDATVRTLYCGLSYFFRNIRYMISINSSCNASVMTKNKPMSAANLAVSGSCRRALIIIQGEHRYTSIVEMVERCFSLTFPHLHSPNPGSM